MPNWCYHNLVVQGDAENIRQFKQTVASQEQVFDFNNIIPMPKELEAATAHSDSPELIEALKEDWNLKASDLFSQEAIDHAKQSLTNLLHYGAANWYDWCCSHWGTKWNACESYLHGEDNTSLTYSFNTAWCEPRPIFEELLKRFPRLSFRIEFHEESDVKPLGDEDDDDCFWSEHWCCMESDALSEEEIQAGAQRQWLESDYWTED